MIDKSKIIICRCEDVTLQQIDEAIDRGYHTYEDLKRLLRIGMGPCQGNTCGHLIQMHLAKRLGQSIEEIKTHRPRPMLLGVKIKEIVDGTDK
ncbi:MAG: (2Fe-2S)-binding protein [Bacilli bacterium]|jgi:bacterioferritin-associated ferredoxin